jgi:hypothetical protein
MEQDSISVVADNSKLLCSPQRTPVSVTSMDVPKMWIASGRHYESACQRFPSCTDVPAVYNHLQLMSCTVPDRMAVRTVVQRSVQHRSAVLELLR